MLSSDAICVGWQVCISGKFAFFAETTSEDMANKSKDDQIRELKAALKKVQKEAELEKLRAKAYGKMIDLAEERFNIPIRKKSGTKQ